MPPNPLAAFDDPDPDGPSVVEGSVRYAPWRGVNVDALLTPDDRNVVVQCLDFASPHSAVLSWTHKLG